MDKRVLEVILAGLSDKNIRFTELRNLILSLGFDERGKENHRILAKASVAEIVNLQPLKDGRAKAYQVKQVRSIIPRYKLHRESEDV